MITGDYPETAGANAGQDGIEAGTILAGADLGAEGEKDARKPFDDRGDVLQRLLREGQVEPIMPFGGQGSAPSTLRVVKNATNAAIYPSSFRSPSPGAIRPRATRS